ncbi:hypothetical protein BJ165DRAFT_362696 [Panaeolus papilionaceus]|nr:hypothetical protein BJ165DRAFT_362696 [Panaeolus papilionaceus]
MVVEAWRFTSPEDIFRFCRRHGERCSDYVHNRAFRIRRLERCSFQQNALDLSKMVLQKGIKAARNWTVFSRLKYTLEATSTIQFNLQAPKLTSYTAFTSNDIADVASGAPTTHPADYERGGSGTGTYCVIA